MQAWMRVQRLVFAGRAGWRVNSRANFFPRKNNVEKYRTNLALDMDGRAMHVPSGVGPRGKG